MQQNIKNFSRSLMLLCSFTILTILLGCESVPKTFAQDTSPAPEPSSEVIKETQGQYLPITAQAVIANKTIQLEVAKTPEQQSMGLMYRSSLPEDRGMLFPIRPARPVQFWMKNCRMSLDIIFLFQGVVKEIAPNVPPCLEDPCPVYGPNNKLIDQVIELRGGWTKEYGLKVGDRIAVQFLN
jgi:uncharacterized membrane protein (UPF0127 family)